MPMDAVDYVDYRSQQLDMSDITANTVKYCIENCPQPEMEMFPAIGNICTMNNRLMVPLMCQRSPFHPKSSEILPIVPLVFVVCTGSPYTYLTTESITALSGSGRSDCYAFIQSNRVIQCYQSYGKFAHVNVLGMDFLSKNRLSLHIDFDSLTFSLSKRFDPVYPDDIVD